VCGDPPIAVASEVLALVLGIANRARRPRAGLHGFVAQASFERHKVEVKHLGIHLHAALARADGDGSLHIGTGTATLAGGSGGCRDSAARAGRLDGGRVASRTGVRIVAVGRNADGSFGQHLLNLIARNAHLVAAGHLEALSNSVGVILGDSVGRARRRKRSVDGMVGDSGRSVGIGGGSYGSRREGRHGVRLRSFLGKTALARTFLWNRWAITDDVAHLLFAVPDESLGARVASDATAFTDEVLVLGLVKDVEDVGDAGGAALQSFTAEALMARADDAVDAAVSARSRDCLMPRMGISHHWRSLYPKCSAFCFIKMRFAGATCGVGDNGAIMVSAPTFVAATLTRLEISSVFLARDVICVKTHSPQIFVVL